MPSIKSSRNWKLRGARRRLGDGDPAGRLDHYDPAWLDDQCLAGRIAWARLKPRNGRPNGKDRRAAPVRSTPITLLPRRHGPLWASLATPAEPIPLTANAKAVADFIREHGASFFDELIDGARLLRSQVEEALAELVALGLVTADSFAGLRYSCPRACASRRRPPTTSDVRVRYGRRGPMGARAPCPATTFETEPVEHIARPAAPLRRGVLARARARGRLAATVAGTPARLSPARSARRNPGGRFVAGFPGEHFALPEAVGMLREVRRKQNSGAWVSLSGADPLNLAGVLTPGAEARRPDRQPRAVPGRRSGRTLRRQRSSTWRSWTRPASGRLATPCCGVRCRDLWCISLSRFGLGPG